MDLEWHQLELRYEKIRRRDPARERQLLSSLVDYGQQQPIVVVALQSGSFVLIDGYKRVRALKRLHHDTASVILWDLAEAEALMLERLMGNNAEGPLEQGWLLQELQLRFGLGLEEQ